MQTKVLSFSLRASGWFLSNLGRPFPGLTARLFLHLYGTPPRRKFTGSQLASRVSAKPGRKAFTKYSFDPGLLQIHTYTWGGPGKKVLLMHGWAGTGLGFQTLVEALTRDGFEVVSYDAPAHGESEGKWTTLVQWMQPVDKLLRQKGALYAIFGQRLGDLGAAL